MYMVKVALIMVLSGSGVAMVMLVLDIVFVVYSCGGVKGW